MGRILHSLSVAFLMPALAGAGDGVVALQTADPSCPDDSGDTYVDCGNGTVTDNRTGLVWLKNAGCFGSLTWHEVLELVGGLSDLPDGDICGSLAADDCDCGLSDGSSPGEWRMPSMGELLAMVADADGDPGELDCNPTITNDQGTGCWSPSCHSAGFCSFYGVEGLWYWSSSTFVPDPTDVFGVHLAVGGVAGTAKDDPGLLWPVRGGQ